MLGKSILVALVRVDDNGAITSQEQFLAKVAAVDEEKISLRRPDGRASVFPYVQHAIQLAPRGTYTLASTGVRVVDPDFLTAWVMMGDRLQDGSFWAEPIHPDPHISRLPSQWHLEYRHDPPYLRRLINEVGAEYIGKSVMIGLTDSQTRTQRQLYGRISSVNFERGITVVQETGEEYHLPPDLSLLWPAPPGEYRMRSTGKTVVDPDFLTSFEVSRSQEPKGNTSPTVQ